MRNRPHATTAGKGPLIRCVRAAKVAAKAGETAAATAKSLQNKIDQVQTLLREVA